MSAEGWVWFVMLVSAGSLLMAFLFTRQVLAADTGTKGMQEIAAAIKEGAEAFLKRQYSTIFYLSLALAAIIFFFYVSHKGMELAWKTTVAFAVGAICSAIAGFSGMFVSIRANLRAATAARSSLGRALQLALRGGAVTGLAVVAMSLLGVGGLFLLFGGMKHPDTIPYQLVGFGFGASFVALFAQLGGGIYTKAADVGADLVGKVEAGIPEDDPRNPAVIADNVGDNVGDCAGMAADLFETYAVTLIATMALGALMVTGSGGSAVVYPLALGGVSILASVIGIFAVRGREGGKIMNALYAGVIVAAILSIIGFFFVSRCLMSGMPSIGYLGVFEAAVVGPVLTVVLVAITEYYTGTQFPPVKHIAKASTTGHATNIIAGHDHETVRVGA